MKRVIPERLKEARIQAGLSVSQVAKMTAYSKETVERLENGDFVVSGEVDIFAEMYGVSDAWLRGEEKPLELTPEHLDQLAKLSPEDRDKIIDFLQSIQE